MCTALSLTTKDQHYFFGRNMDLDYSFDQEVTLVPRHFTWHNTVTDSSATTTYAMMGMAKVVNHHPLFADAFNEKGLACAGLNFPGYGVYADKLTDKKIHVAPYDIMLCLLGECATVAEVTALLPELEIVGIPFLPSLPLPTLHWIVSDCFGDSLVIERTADGLKWFTNPLGILTNSPDFAWHLTHLKQFIGLHSTQPESATWHNLNLTPLGQGLGLYGLPGDFTPPSRFVRTAYLKSHATFLENFEQGLAQFFHILANVAMVGGSVITPHGHDDLTLYTSCMSQDQRIYYYTTYLNPQITAIHMDHENLDASELKQFGYNNHLQVYTQNAATPNN